MVARIQTKTMMVFSCHGPGKTDEWERTSACALADLSRCFLRPKREFAVGSFSFVFLLEFTDAISVNQPRSYSVVILSEAKNLGLLFVLSWPRNGNRLEMFRFAQHESAFVT